MTTHNTHQNAGAARSERRGIGAIAAAVKGLAALTVTALSLVVLLPQTDVIAIQAILA